MSYGHDPVVEQIHALQQQVQQLAAQAQAEQAPPPEINLTITLPPLELHITNDVAPPDVHVSNDVHPPAATPAPVHVAAKPPEIKVTVPAGSKEVTFTRDQNGLITGATVKETGGR